MTDGFATRQYMWSLLLRVSASNHEFRVVIVAPGIHEAIDGCDAVALYGHEDMPAIAGAEVVEIRRGEEVHGVWRKVEFHRVEYDSAPLEGFPR